ncbi:hypothetical protein AYO45_05070 [Gammaproteobacteria bacterium SCGC AG-212-F23]|nr:hypothetical protein AYO45_05070 [Gammaproteobacteria bacterium SCGC AG-212-F23]
MSKSSQSLTPNQTTGSPLLPPPKFTGSLPPLPPMTPPPATTTNTKTIIHSPFVHPHSPKPTAASTAATVNTIIAAAVTANQQSNLTTPTRPTNPPQSNTPSSVISINSSLAAAGTMSPTPLLVPPIGVTFTPTNNLNTKQTSITDSQPGLAPHIAGYSPPPPPPPTSPSVFDTGFIKTNRPLLRDRNGSMTTQPSSLSAASVNNALNGSVSLNANGNSVSSTSPPINIDVKLSSSTTATNNTNGEHRIDIADTSKNTTKSTPANNSSNGPTSTPVISEAAKTARAAINAKNLLTDISTSTEDPHWVTAASIAIIAAYSAASSASTIKDFGDHFIEALEQMISALKTASETTQQAVSWAIAGVPGTLAQFSLAFTSNVEKITEIWNSMSQRTVDGIRENPKEFVKKMLGIIFVVLPSSAGTIKQSHDCEYLNDDMKKTVYGGRGLAGATTNGKFYLDKFHTKADDLERDIIFSILTAQKKMKKAKERGDRAEKNIKDPHLEFINAVEPLLTTLKNRKSAANSSEQDAKTPKDVTEIRKILDALHNISATLPEDEKDLFESKNAKLIFLGKVLGGIASFQNFKTALTIPEWWGWPIYKDLADIYFSFSWPTFGVTMFATAVFALQSFLANYSINSSADEFFIEKAGKINKEGFKKHFYDDTSRWEKFGLAVVGYTSLGLGVGNGGSTYKYPIFATVYWAVPTALITTAVFIALGTLAINLIGDKAKRLYYRKMLKQALACCDTGVNGLRNFYQTIPADGTNPARPRPEHEQRILAEMLHVYFDLATNACRKFFNNMKKEEIAPLLGTDLVTKLESYRSLNTVTSVSHPHDQKQRTGLTANGAANPINVVVATADGSVNSDRDRQVRTHWPLTLWCCPSETDTLTSLKVPLLSSNNGNIQDAVLNSATTPGQPAGSDRSARRAADNGGESNNYTSTRRSCC